MLNMPIALGVADGFSTDSDFYNIVGAYDVLHYFWEPDVTFKRLDPVMIVQVDVAVEPRVLASTELARLAPDACELLSNIEFSLEDYVRLTERKCMLPYATYISTYYLYFQRIWDFKKHLLLQT